MPTCAIRKYFQGRYTTPWVKAGLDDLLVCSSDSWIAVLAGWLAVKCSVEVGLKDTRDARQ